jgi:hypothetical protein
MTTKERLEKELKELEESCKQAREILESNFEQDSFELLEEILTNQTKYLVHSIRFGQVFKKSDIYRFNRVCLYVNFEDGETMYISLPICDKENGE